MSGVRTIDVASGEAGLRLDRWFKRHFPEITHVRLQKWLRTGQVRVDGRRARAGARLEAGQRIRVPPLGGDDRPRPASQRPPPPDAAEAEAVRALVIHRDDQVIAIDKPPGLAVQGGTGTRRHLDGMLDALRFDAPERPRLVHRLDKDTSGVLLLARSAAAAAALTRSFRAKTARKVYWALVVGVPKPARGTVDLALAKAPGRGGEKVVSGIPSAKRALTRYAVVEHLGRKVSWLILEPLTGRTHQLRAHCLALGTPIVGDGKYGGAAAFLPGAELERRLDLHARALRIPHPGGGTLEVTAPLPGHMRQSWRLLGFDETAIDPFAEG
jgi:23S rRNA pseudouridine955/2504/2580 synthase